MASYNKEIISVFFEPLLHCSEIIWFCQWEILWRTKVKWNDKPKWTNKWHDDDGNGDHNHHVNSPNWARITNSSQEDGKRTVIYLSWSTSKINGVGDDDDDDDEICTKKILSRK